MDWTSGIMKGLLLIGALAGAVIGVIIVMLIAVIVGGIFGDTVIPALGLGTAATANATAVITTLFTFIGNLNSGLLIVGALLLIAIVIAVFGGAGYLGYKAYTSGKGKGGNNTGNF